VGTAAKVGRGVGKTIKWTFIAFGLLIIVIVIVAIVSIGNAGNSSNASSAHVTAAKYAATHNGMTIAAVETLIGAKPESTQTSSVAGSTMDCIYYGVISTKGTYQFCFTNGALNSKSKY
jgi:hypothetical protein